MSSQAVSIREVCATIQPIVSEEQLDPGYREDILKSEIRIQASEHFLLEYAKVEVTISNIVSCEVDVHFDYHFNNTPASGTTIHSSKILIRRALGHTV